MALNETVRWIAVIALLFVVYYVTSIVTLKRNILKVVRIFENKNALSDKLAISSENLGIRKQAFLERAIKKRDNKIHALQFLINAGLVIVTSDGRCYLNKKKMAIFRRDGNVIVRFIIPPLND
jgi:hypothetical protein